MIKWAVVFAGALSLALGVLPPAIVHAAGELSVLDCALGRTVDVQVHDTYLLIGGPRSTWAARFLLAAAIGALALAVLGKRQATRAACAAFLIVIGWLFAEIGISPSPEEPACGDWSTYPEASVESFAVVIASPLHVWAALIASAILLLFSTRYLDADRAAEHAGRVGDDAPLDGGGGDGER